MPCCSQKQTAIWHTQVAPVCASKHLLEGRVGRSSCCWWRGLSLLSMDLAEPWGRWLLRQLILPPPGICLGSWSPPLSLPGGHKHVAAYLCSCCSYVLSELMIHRGLGGICMGRRQGGSLRRVGCIRGKQSTSRGWWLSSVVCHFGNWIAIVRDAE